jgi:hypothetical protein
MVMSDWNGQELLTYDIEEGNFTVVSKSLAVPNGEKLVTGTFAAQIEEENFLQQGDGDNSLQLATTLATHFNPYEPEVAGDGLPDISTIEANMPRRIVGAVLLKPGEYLLPLIATNAKIVPKDNLTVAVGDATGLDKQTGASTDVAVALENVAANTGGYIRCRVKGPIDME